MESRRVTRGKRIRYDNYDQGIEDSEDGSEERCGSGADQEDDEDSRRRKSIRETNKEFARRMTILQTWSEHWEGYKTREGEAYTKQEARNILKRAKKITCPIPGCKRSFISMGGLRYHYARCDIAEKSYKCKVCDPHTVVKTQGDLWRHMVRAHMDSLPPLPQEQAEIAHIFLTTVRRSEKTKGRRALGDISESISAHPKSFIKSFAELIASATHPLNIVSRPFRDWYASNRDWDILVTDIDRRRFCPPEATSVRFKTSRHPHWSSLNVGESDILRADGDQPSSMILFTGGVNTAVAWAPKPCNPSLASYNEHFAIAVNACPMDRSIMFKDMKDITGCIQFWTTTLCSLGPASMPSPERPVVKPKLEFIIGHNFGVISAMSWCPLGASFDSPDEEATLPAGSMPRLGLLALACGDAIVRIISVPHFDQLMRRPQATGGKQPTIGLDATPMFRVKPIAILMPPGVGLSTDHLSISCTSFSWNVDDNQRLIAAGYSTGDVCLFDLANSSPILYSQRERQHIYHSYRRWQAHLLPVVGVSILSNDVERTLLASGGQDRVLRMWDSSDMEACLEFERAPITNLIWDYRLKGVVSSSEAAFTSFLNRVSYRYPCSEGSIGSTVSIHRTTVCGLNNSLITSAVATSDEAGEVFVQPTGRPNPKRNRNLLDTFSLYTLLPRQRTNEPSQSANLSQASATSDYDRKPGTNINSAIPTSTTTIHEISLNGNNLDPNNEAADLENQIIDDYTYAERPIANKPAKFLLPIDERAVDTYNDFKANYGLEFVEYDDSSPKGSHKLPEAWQRASNTSNIYCDRVCDYPFSAIKQVTWSPNVSSYSFLLSVSHVGLCRIDRIKTMETIYSNHIGSMLGSAPSGHTATKESKH